MSLQLTQQITLEKLFEVLQNELEKKPLRLDNILAIAEAIKAIR